jgi:hypothetical protein
VHGSDETVDVLSLKSDATTPTGETKVWRIDEPDVSKPNVAHQPIALKAGDTVAIQAGGCVQTGGLGLTWKSYADPRGHNSNRLYSGTVTIPGTPTGRIAEFIGKTVTVPELPQGAVDTPMYLTLGYEDDDYDDNGYWGRDDGTEGQCVGAPPAWVEVTVTSPATTPPPQRVWSPHSKPFDLVWDVNTEDFNGLPLNPQWGYQLDNGGQPPNFRQWCGKAIPTPPPGGTTHVDDAVMAEICTSQAPTTDVYTDEFIHWFGMCPCDPLNGHINWMVGTYVGQITWADYSGGWPQDDDYNLKLTPPGSAGLTTASKAIGLEFNGNEVAGQCGSRWWSRFKTAAESGPDQAKQMMGGDDGVPGVVTGLIGLDAVHDAYTESHPVFSLALRTDRSVDATGTTDTWSFFLRNSGGEGGCSSNKHYWDSPSHEYILELPQPDGATDVAVQSAEIFAWDDTSLNPQIESAPGWTLVRFTFPDAGEHGVDGQLTVRYANVSPRPAPAANPTPAVQGPAHPPEPELDDQLVAKIKDPSVRVRFTKALKALSKPAAPRKAPKPIVVNPTVRPYDPKTHPPKKAAPTRARSAPHAEQQKLQTQRNDLLRQFKIPQP